MFLNCTSDATNNKSFCLVLTAINEVRKGIYYKVDYIPFVLIINVNFWFFIRLLTIVQLIKTPGCIEYGTNFK